MTKNQLEREWNAYDIGYETGEIAAWQHIITLCKSCIRAHRKIVKEMKKKGGGTSHEN